MPSPSALTYSIASQRYPLLDNSTVANEVGAAADRTLFHRHMIQVMSPGAVEVTIEISGDGQNWVPLVDGTITGNGYLIVDNYIPFFRAIRDNSTTAVTVMVYSTGFSA